MITATLEPAGNDPMLLCREPQMLRSLESLYTLTKNGQVLYESADTANHSSDQGNYWERVRYPVCQSTPFYCSLK